MSDPKQTAQRTPTRTQMSRISSNSRSPGGNVTNRSSSVRGTSGRPSRGGTSRSGSQSSLLSTHVLTDDAGDEDARAEHTAILEEFRSRVQRAEVASEEYQKQLSMLQARLDESHQSHGRLEDQLHEKVEKVEELEAERVRAARQKRDLERLFDEERTSMIRDREEQRAEQEDLREVVVRLKESLSMKDKELTETKAAGDFRQLAETPGSDQFAPTLTGPSAEQPSDELVKAVEQKDQVIKSLRIELAEAQIKIMEIDSMGDGKLHDLERALMDVKITNARLMEDNESFQLLLSEKTLNGDFSKADAMQTSEGLGSLAEELGTEDIESAEGKSDDFRKLEMEVKSLKDQNKALALYIENIIGRLLSHKEFENLLDRTPDLMSGKPVVNNANTDKELPPPPTEKDLTEGSTGSSFLQRARSVVAGPSKPRPRPMSQISQASGTPGPASPAMASGPTAPNEDPAKAPSILLGRSSSVRTGTHTRTQSDMPPATPIVNQMYRGPPSSGSSAAGPMMSPSISSSFTNATRTSFFAPPAPGPTALANPAPSSRAPSGTGSRNSTSEHRPGSSSGSTFSDGSGEAVGSPPRAGSVANNYTGAVMTQNRLRPLRLVQENPELESRRKEDEATAARKKANRTSWMPTWMGQRNFSGGESNS